MCKLQFEPEVEAGRVFNCFEPELRIVWRICHIRQSIFSLLPLYSDSQVVSILRHLTSDTFINNSDHFDPLRRQNHTAETLKAPAFSQPIRVSRRMSAVHQ